MTSMSLARASALALVASGVLAAPVLAQTAQLDDIVVTAERRETSLQRTPLSVSVAAQPLLAGAGVVDIKDLAILTPGLLVASSSNQTNTTARIRGIGGWQGRSGPTPPRTWVRSSHGAARFGQG